MKALLGFLLACGTSSFCVGATCTDVFDPHRTCKDTCAPPTTIDTTCHFDEHHHCVGAAGH